MDNLIITRKLKLKKKRFKCVLNINTMCESERSESIVRSAYNVCKQEAYYQRIVPICLRKVCSGEGDISNCCRSTLSREYKEDRRPKVESLSPVSSVALTEVFATNISYEDVSNGSFSSDSEESEDELDTLIKRTKQRERQIHHSYPIREYTSTPLSKDDCVPTPSPYSIDTDKKSIHSDTTMVLQPLSSEAYSPTGSLDIKKEHIEETVSDKLPYSPTMTPDLIKMEMDYSPVKNDDDNIPYSPTFTPENIEIDDPARNVSNDINAPNIFSSVFIKEEKDYITTNSKDGNEYEPYPSSLTPDMIKMGNPNRAERICMDNVNTNYTDFHKYTGNTPYEYSATSKIKQEKLDDKSTINCANIPTYSALLANDLIKRETYKDCNNLYSTETDYNMNNTNNCKNERDDSQRWRIREADTKGIVIKIESEDKNGDLVNPTFQNTVVIKTEDIY